MVATFGLVIVVLLINGFHTEHRIELGEVSWVHLIPAHYERTVWKNDKWDVHISLKKDDCDIILDQPPPDWLTLHKLLVVTYSHGHVYNDILLEDVKPSL